MELSSEVARVLVPDCYNEKQKFAVQWVVRVGERGRNRTFNLLIKSCHVSPTQLGLLQSQPIQIVCY